MLSGQGGFTPPPPPLLEFRPLKKKTIFKWAKQFLIYICFNITFLLLPMLALITFRKTISQKWWSLILLQNLQQIHYIHVHYYIHFNEKIIHNFFVWRWATFIFVSFHCFFVRKNKYNMNKQNLRFVFLVCYEKLIKIIIYPSFQFKKKDYTYTLNMITCLEQRAVPWEHQQK